MKSLQFCCFCELPQHEYKNAWLFTEAEGGILPLFCHQVYYLTASLLFGSTQESCLTWVSISCSCRSMSLLADPSALCSSIREKCSMLLMDSFSCRVKMTSFHTDKVIVNTIWEACRYSSLLNARNHKSFSRLNTRKNMTWTYNLQQEKKHEMWISDQDLPAVVTEVQNAPCFNHNSVHKVLKVAVKRGVCTL